MEDSDWKLRVTSVHPSGRRQYDPVSKERLIERCLQPGASVAQLALDHGVNANLLWKWIRKYRLAREDSAMLTEPCTSAFIPVEVEKVARVVVPVQDKLHGLRSPEPEACLVGSGGSGSLFSPARLNTSLPNGVQLAFEFSDANAVSSIIGVLCDVQTGS